jgi:hypothetical protein
MGQIRKRHDKKQHRDADCRQNLKDRRALEVNQGDYNGCNTKKPKRRDHFSTPAITG